MSGGIWSIKMSRSAPRFFLAVPPILLSGALLLGLPACSDDGCPTCIDGVNPEELIDPLTLGDGSGYPGATWAAAPNPRLLGWSEKRLRSVTDYAKTLNSDGFMVVDRGVVVWEYGNTSRNLIVQSCRKSFLSALYGIYHDQGLIDLETTMEELGIDDLPPSLTPEEKQATIEQLLMARSGVYHEAAAESQSMKDARPARGSHAPGTFWYYNNWDYGYMWWVGKPGAWGGHTVYAARGGGGQAIFVVKDMEVVITHKVDNDRWYGDWSDVYSLVRRILDAKVY